MEQSYSFLIAGSSEAPVQNGDCLCTAQENRWTGAGMAFVPDGRSASHNFGQCSGLVQKAWSDQTGLFEESGRWELECCRGHSSTDWVHSLRLMEKIMAGVRAFWPYLLQDKGNDEYGDEGA